MVVASSTGADTAGLIEDRLDALLGWAAGPGMWDALSPEPAAKRWRALRERRRRES